MRPATLPATSGLTGPASHYSSEGFERLTFCGRKPRTRKYTTQGAAFYAQDFISDISVCIVSGHRHGTKYGISYTKSGDTKHHHKPKPEYNRHTTRNNIDPARNHFHHYRNRLNHGFNGHLANYAARDSRIRKPGTNSGNARSGRQRRIGNRRNHGFHTDANRNFDHGSALHAFQQRQHISHSKHYAFIG